MVSIYCDPVFGAVAAMIKQFVTDVAWQDVDYLLIDTPPGTSDEHIAILESLRWVAAHGRPCPVPPRHTATASVGLAGGRIGRPRIRLEHKRECGCHDFHL